MKNLFFLLIVCCQVAQAQTISTASWVPAARALIGRVVPQRAAMFAVEGLGADRGNDVFEVESRDGRVVLRGNDGVAVASALYFYLTEYCHCQVTWNGDNLRLPADLPVVERTMRRMSPYRYRYYLNYCTFNYSMAWWDWRRWQREIDWMALHGINLPLAITGEEYTWYRVYRKMGFTDGDLRDFFCGPAYFSWFWMGNLDGWGGPLPLHWMEGQAALQKKILARERELGMRPVLPAFTGHVPAAFRRRFPEAPCKATNWKNGFGDVYILDARDTLFASLGKRFLDEQTALFGTDHFYSADTFNENEPPSNDPGFLAGLSAKVYEGMRRADPAAVWVMQGWLFYSDRTFWQAPQVEALLNAVPDTSMLLLDLAAEIEPVWKRTQAFYHKPWVWCMLNNFGGNVNLFGRMDGVASGPAAALGDPASGKMEGIGLTMEGIATNPVLYELTMQQAWQGEPVDVDSWLPQYVLNRYGVSSEAAVEAWQVLRRTVYNGKLIRDGAESIVTGRPTMDSTTVWTRTLLNYAPGDLLPAWDLFLKCDATTEGYRFDLVDMTRQVMANYGDVLQRRWVAAWRAGDMAGFDKWSAAFIGLIRDLDALLATQKDFLLGPWLADARRKGVTPAEKNLYEQNARDLITLWGDKNSPLHEYANRQWSGLLNDFYKVRWEKYFSFLRAARREGREPDFAGFDAAIRDWEWSWVRSHKDYPVAPVGDAVAVVKKMYAKYRKEMGAAWGDYDITRFGAVGDGQRDNTKAIQAAIDAAAGVGGGRVSVPAGRFVTGVLTMRSGVVLRLDSGAVLLASTHRMDYGSGNAMPLIQAHGARNIGIEGRGVIDGRGDALLKDLYERIKDGQIKDGEWQTPNPWGQVRPAEENRPKMIFFQNCDGVSIRGITLKNGLDWVQDYKSCSNLVVDSIRVESNTFWNNDGIDIVDCKQVRVTNSSFNADDDGICLKSEDRQDSCADIYIAHCTIRSSASALKFGTASRGGFHRVTVRDIRVYDTYRSAIALEAVDGGKMTDVDIQGVRATNTGNALFIRLGHRNRDSVYSLVRGIRIADVDVVVPAGKPDAGYPMEGPVAPGIRNVLPSVIAGLAGHPVEDVVLENVRVQYPGGGVRGLELVPLPEKAGDYPEFSMFGELPCWGLYLRHVEGIRLKGVKLELLNADGREERVGEDVRGLVER
ncbi:MAG TPA: alpha-N-acetylglucosaminidase TIM-barrel domain-containing protein [Puia sp.]|uniref:alpha-N-acetylglucosaminidase TIM-barrel domain-containing protein n=1 Tax=Puia sp. TaxID=2045100 RepID=UPI002C93E125|nr:alpha-N-acetylglucosaminidase TIM-barrel domain-containing protein [Puia sp.]HVU94038.1 alpha-N-acetylglucosaminidase TIM-barrel domain-containing protein [Puia sp.]